RLRSAGNIIRRLSVARVKRNPHHHDVSNPFVCWIIQFEYSISSALLPGQAQPGVCFIFWHSSTIVSVADLAQQYLPVHNKLILEKNETHPQPVPYTGSRASYRVRAGLAPALVIHGSTHPSLSFCQRNSPARHTYYAIIMQRHYSS